MEDILSFKPSYVWPNPAFPFRVYYDGPKCRIFIIENIQHNWNWMSQWAGRFRETDFFFVYCGWYHSPSFAKEADRIFKILQLRKDRFFIMFNSELEKSNFTPFGFQGDVINHNAWLDEDLVMRPLPESKVYRAIYVARRSAFKRHHLASQVEGLALVAGINHGNAEVELPPHAYLNSAPLSAEEVCVKINQSRCGLILSASEGACFSSSEYLLCGIPVVSTPSTGGRDVWYNDYNSIVCEPESGAVAAAVDEFVTRPRDPRIIRQMHVEQAKLHRQRFVAALADIFEQTGVTEVHAEKYYLDTVMHKLRKSYRPDFEAIFGS